MFRYADMQSWRNLGAPGAPAKWMPGVLSAVAVHVLQVDWSWRPRWLTKSAKFLPSSVALFMMFVVNIIPGAKENGWLAQVPSGTSQTAMFTLLPWNHLGDHNSTAGGYGHPIPPVDWELLWGGGLFIAAIVQVS